MIFMGPMFETAREEEILRHSRRGISNAANCFQWSVLNGVYEATGEGVPVINVLPVGIWPRQYRQLVLPDRIWENHGAHCHEVGGVNLPLLKQFSRAWRLKRLLRQIDPAEEILLCTTYLPFLWALSVLPDSVGVTAIITDLPEYADMHRVSSLRRLLRKIHNIFVYRCLKRVDRFVLLTQQMAEPLRVGDRPYLVMEGICPIPAQRETPVKTEKQIVILYSGRLNRRYGVGDLLEAFVSLTDDRLALWICGAGEMESEICALAQRDARVRFWGFQPHDQTLALQRAASVLVNPRTCEGEYTKYSFPSKTMEYMASGTPVVMYRLPGIPDDYDPYLVYVDGSGAQALREALLRVCSLTQAERDQLGSQAKEFVLSQKNEKRQASRILDLIASREPLKQSPRTS